MDTPRLLDYFAVYGLDEELPLAQSPSSATSTNSQNSSSAKLSTNENIVSHLRLRITNDNEIITPHNSEFIKSFEIGSKNGQTLWLEVIYGRLSGKAKKMWDGKAVSNIGLWYLQYEDDYIKIPASLGIEPVPIYIGIKSAYQFSHIEYENNCYIVDYDISTILETEDRPGTRIILTYNTFDAFGHPPISDIKLVAASTKIDENGNSRKVAEIPFNYSYIDVTLGKDLDSLLCFTTIDPMSVTYKAELIEKFPRDDYSDGELNQAIQMFIFSEGINLSKEQETPKIFSFMLTSAEETGKISKIYITSMIFYEQISERLSKQLYIHQSDTNKVYMPKAICLVSHWPFIEQYREILKEIYRFTISTYETPIERIICNLMQEVPLPDQGVTTVQYKIGNKILHFSRPPPKHLPYFPDSCLEYLFRSLPIDSILNVFSSLLVEKKILLISKQKSLLTYAAIGFVSLIFPFKWEQVFIPILPAALKNYIETIFPYIIGVSPSFLTDDIEIPYDAVKVYLDEGRIESNEGFPRLPDKLRRQLYNSLMRSSNIFNCEDNIRDTADEAFDIFIKDENDNFDAFQVRDAFLHFFTHLLKKYSKFYIMPVKATDKVIDSRSCFNTLEFLNYHKSNKPETLLFKLTETSLFAGFIESRYFSTESQYEMEYFDEASVFKRTKNDPYYVKPYYNRETVPALYANDIGFEPDSAFRYERFPKLNDCYMIEPRKVITLATNAAPKLLLTLKDDILIRLTQAEWGKFLMTTLYKVWIIVFAHCMPRYKEHANLLVDLALFVMDGMKKTTKKPDEEMYRKLIEACGHCGLKERVLSLFRRMKNQGIEPDACTHGVYVTAVAKSQELQKEIKSILSKEIPANSLCNSLDLKNCKYVVEDHCTYCDCILSQEDIMMGWDRSYSSYTTTCPKNFCEWKFSAKFRVILDKFEENPKFLQVEYLSPPLIRKELENAIYTHGENILLSKDFCEKHKILFWNMALNFQLLKLPFFFIDPSFNPENLPQVIKEYMKTDNAPQGEQFLRPCSNKSNEDAALSDETISESNSTSQHRSQRFLKLLKKNKSSGGGSDNMSTKSSVKNMTIKKLFGPFIEEFRSENIRRDRGRSFMDEIEVEEIEEEKPHQPPQLPQFRAYSLKI